MLVLPQCDVSIDASQSKMALRRVEQHLLRFFLFAIKLYQRFLSPLLGPRCRFYPTCSAYAAQSLQKYGLIKGSRKTITRLCRCQPWHPGGVDLP